MNHLKKHSKKKNKGKINKKITRKKTYNKYYPTPIPVYYGYYPYYPVNNTITNYGYYDNYYINQNLNRNIDSKSRQFYNRYFNYQFDKNKYSYYKNYPKDFVMDTKFNMEKMNKKTPKLKSGKNHNILDIFINLLNIMNIDHNPLQVNNKIKDFIYDIKDYISIITDFDFHDSIKFIKRKMLKRKTNTETFNEFDIFKALNTFKSFVDFAGDKIDKNNYGLKKHRGGFNKNIKGIQETKDNVTKINLNPGNSKNLKGGALGELDILAYFSGEKREKVKNEIINTIYMKGDDYKSDRDSIKSNESIDTFLDIFLRAKILPYLLINNKEIYQKKIDYNDKEEDKTKQINKTKQDKIKNLLIIDTEKLFNEYSDIKKYIYLNNNNWDRYIKKTPLPEDIADSKNNLNNFKIFGIEKITLLNNEVTLETGKKKNNKYCLENMADSLDNLNNSTKNSKYISYSEKGHRKKIINENIYKKYHHDAIKQETINDDMEELIDYIIKFRNLQIPDTEEARNKEKDIRNYATTIEFIFIFLSMLDAKRFDPDADYNPFDLYVALICILRGDTVGAVLSFLPLFSPIIDFLATFQRLRKWGTKIFGEGFATGKRAKKWAEKLREKKKTKLEENTEALEEATKLAEDAATKLKKFDKETAAQVTKHEGKSLEDLEKFKPEGKFKKEEEDAINALIAHKNAVKNLEEVENAVKTNEKTLKTLESQEKALAEATGAEEVAKAEKALNKTKAEMKRNAETQYDNEIDRLIDKKKKLGTSHEAAEEVNRLQTRIDGLEKQQTNLKDLKTPLPVEELKSFFGDGINFQHNLIEKTHLPKVVSGKPVNTKTRELLEGAQKKYKKQIEKSVKENAKLNFREFKESTRLQEKTINDQILRNEKKIKRYEAEGRPTHILKKNEKNLKSLMEDLKNFKEESKSISKKKNLKTILGGTSSELTKGKKKLEELKKAHTNFEAKINKRLERMGILKNETTGELEVAKYTARISEAEIQKAQREAIKANKTYDRNKTKLDELVAKPQTGNFRAGRAQQALIKLKLQSLRSNAIQLKITSLNLSQSAKTAKATKTLKPHDLSKNTYEEILLNIAEQTLPLTSELIPSLRFVNNARIANKEYFDINDLEKINREVMHGNQATKKIYDIKSGKGINYKQILETLNREQSKFIKQERVLNESIKTKVTKHFEKMAPEEITMGAAATAKTKPTGKRIIKARTHAIKPGKKKIAPEIVDTYDMTHLLNMSIPKSVAHEIEGASITVQKLNTYTDGAVKKRLESIYKESLTGDDRINKLSSYISDQFKLHGEKLGIKEIKEFSNIEKGRNSLKARKEVMESYRHLSEINRIEDFMENYMDPISTLYVTMGTSNEAYSTLERQHKDFQNEIERKTFLGKFMDATNSGVVGKVSNLLNGDFKSIVDFDSAVKEIKKVKDLTKNPTPNKKYGLKKELLKVKNES